jgi:cytochrome P450
VWVSLYHTHRIPECYPQPEQFNPHRWQAITATAGAYIPFGGGPHICIGGPLAVMETKIVLTMVL